MVQNCSFGAKQDGQYDTFFFPFLPSVISKDFKRYPGFDPIAFTTTEN